MHSLSRSVACVMTGLLTTACQTLAFPTEPYTVAKMEAFADPGDLRAVYDLSRSKEKKNKEDIYYAVGLAEQRLPYQYSEGLVTITEPGYQLTMLRKFVVEDSFEESQRAYPMKGLPIHTWNSKGFLVGLSMQNATTNDINQVNRMVHMQALQIDETSIDLSTLNPKLPLIAVSLLGDTVKNASTLCQYPTLEYLEIGMSTVPGQLDFSQCPKGIQTLSLGNSQIQTLTLKNLPKLEALFMAENKIDNLTLDGSTLPNLKSLSLSGTEIKNSASITLPEGLVQLYLEDVTDDDFSHLTLPKSLKYLNLQNARLSDYRFISRAENLTALVLEGSNFKQWSLLAGFTQMKHLRIGASSFQNSDYQYIIGLHQLQFLDLGATAVTTGKPLAELTSLSQLNFYKSPIADLNEIPFIPNIAYLGLPRDEDYDHPRKYPEHIKTMFETTNDYARCNELKPCDSPPWVNDGI